MPDHFVKVLIRLHYGEKVEVKIGDVDSEINSTIGVRQGSCEGPVLFLFIIQAAMEIYSSAFEVSITGVLAQCAA